MAFSANYASSSDLPEKEETIRTPAILIQKRGMKENSRGEREKER